MSRTGRSQAWAGVVATVVLAASAVADCAIGLRAASGALGSTVQEVCGQLPGFENLPGCENCDNFKASHSLWFQADARVALETDQCKVWQFGCKEQCGKVKKCKPPPPGCDTAALAPRSEGCNSVVRNSCKRTCRDTTCKQTCTTDAATLTLPLVTIRTTELTAGSACLARSPSSCRTTCSTDHCVDTDSILALPADALPSVTRSPVVSVGVPPLTSSRRLLQRARPANTVLGRIARTLQQVGIDVLPGGDDVSTDGTPTVDVDLIPSAPPLVSVGADVAGVEGDVDVGGGADEAPSDGGAANGGIIGASVEVPAGDAPLDVDANGDIDVIGGYGSDGVLDGGVEADAALDVPIGDDSLEVDVGGDIDLLGLGGYGGDGALDSDIGVDASVGLPVEVPVDVDVNGGVRVEVPVDIDGTVGSALAPAAGLETLGTGLGAGCNPAAGTLQAAGVGSCVPICTEECDDAADACDGEHSVVYYAPDTSQLVDAAAAGCTIECETSEQECTSDCNFVEVCEGESLDSVPDDGCDEAERCTYEEACEVECNEVGVFSYCFCGV